jgi:hypothetical protein
MAKTCRICNNKVDYCPTCAIVQNPFKRAGYCSEDCYHISMILQKHGSHDATAFETVEALKSYNIDQINLKPSIEDYYLSVLCEVEGQEETSEIIEVEDEFIEEVIPEEDVEVVIDFEEDMTISDIE